MVLISPESLAKVIKKDPKTFIQAIKDASESHQKRAATEALDEQFKNLLKSRLKVG